MNDVEQGRLVDWKIGQCKQSLRQPLCLERNMGWGRAFKSVESNCRGPNSHARLSSEEAQARHCSPEESLHF